MKATDFFRCNFFKHTDDPVELAEEQLSEVSVYYPDYLALTQAGEAPRSRFIEYDGSMIERVSIDWNEGGLVTFFFVGNRSPESLEGCSDFTLEVVLVVREVVSLENMDGAYRGQE